MKAIDFIVGNTVSNVTNEIVEQAKSILIAKHLYTVNITPLCHRHNTARLFGSLFKNIPLRQGDSMPYSSYITRLDKTRSYRDIISHKGCKILVMGSLSEQRCEYSITLTVIRTQNNKNVLDSFVRRIEKEVRKSSIYDPSVIAILNGNTFRYATDKSQRTFENVFLPKNKLDELFTAIKGFQDNKDWYSKHIIPYHYGILLYGPPGTGKSSLITALSNKYKVVPHYVSVDDISDLMSCSEGIRCELEDTDGIKLIVIEDIDSCDFLNYTPDIPEESDMKNKNADFCDAYQIKRNRGSLSHFLNIMDGSKCFTNVIWIFTTNHIERIEPSLIRAGRIDKKILIDYVNEETFADFIQYHFNRHIPDEFKIKEGVSFAEVQDDIVEGKNCDNIIEKYRRKD